MHTNQEGTPGGKGRRPRQPSTTILKMSNGHLPCRLTLYQKRDDHHLREPAEPDPMIKHVLKLVQGHECWTLCTSAAEAVTESYTGQPVTIQAYLP